MGVSKVTAALIAILVTTTACSAAEVGWQAKLREMTYARIVTSGALAVATFYPSLAPQVRDTTPGASLPGNCTGGSGEDSDASCQMAQQADWVKTLCSTAFMGSIMCLVFCYAILSLSDPFGDQQLQYMAVRCGSYIGFFLALTAAWLAMYVAHALPMSFSRWAHGIGSALGVCAVIAILGFTSPY